MALFGEREVCPSAALYRASFLEKSQRAEESRTNRISDFRSLIHLHGELQLGLYLEQDLADWLQGAQSTQLNEAEPMPLLWPLKDGGKSLFCSRCLRDHDLMCCGSAGDGAFLFADLGDVFLADPALIAAGSSFSGLRRWFLCS